MLGGRIDMSATQRAAQVRDYEGEVREHPFTRRREPLLLIPSDEIGVLSDDPYADLTSFRCPSHREDVGHQGRAKAAAACRFCSGLPLLTASRHSVMLASAYASASKGSPCSRTHWEGSRFCSPAAGSSFMMKSAALARMAS